FLDDQVIRAVHVDLAAGILVEEDDIPDLHGFDVGPDGFDPAALRLLLGGIRDVDSASRAFQFLGVADETPILESFKSRRYLFLALLVLRRFTVLLALFGLWLGDRRILLQRRGLGQGPRIAERLVEVPLADGRSRRLLPLHDDVRVDADPVDTAPLGSVV